MIRRSDLMLVPALMICSAFAFGSAEKAEVTVDVNGTWKWMMARNNGGGREVSLTLKQQGEKITGTVSGAGFGGDNDIQDGTFKDGQVTFKLVRSRGGQDITITYTGKLDGDTLKGKATTDTQGQKVPRDWEAHRVKEEAHN